MARIELNSIETVAEPSRRPDAQRFFELGLRYSSVNGVKLDLVEAHRWFNLATMFGYAQARSYRSEIAAELSRAEVARAQRLARIWLTTH